MYNVSIQSGTIHQLGQTGIELILQIGIYE